MLGYRSLFEVDAGDSSAIAEVLAQVHSWLRSKGYAADSLVENGDIARIGPGVEAALTSEEGRDGSHSALFALREETDPRGAWVTQIVAHVPRRDRGRPWVWIDVDQEGVDDVWAGRPRVAEMILQVLPGDDHGAHLMPRPTLLRAEGVDELVDVLTSRERRGPVFVAGSSEELPMAEWATYVSGLLGETVGLSAGYVLDGDATARLAGLVGGRHAVEPGTLRTYLPGLDPASELDSLRHRYLTTETIVRTPRGRIRRSLGRRARDIALTTPVPRWAARVESRLLEATDSRVLGWRPTALVELPEVLPEIAPSGSDASKLDVVLAPEPLSAPRDEGQDARSSTEVAPALAALARDLFGTNLDAGLLRQLAEDRRESVVLAAEKVTLENAARRARALNDRVLRLEMELEDVRKESQDAQLEWALADSEVSERDRVIHALRLCLMEAGQAQAAWDPVEEPSDREVAPSSFAELLVRLDTLDYVRFTGDPAHCDVLDEKMPIGASAKAWSALLALDDYARGKAVGDVSVGVHLYLSNPPPGYLTFSANRHAANESEDVQNNPKYSVARVLPVPAEIDPRGAVFMGAHFKIAQLGMISPRLHYHDATGTDGRIYVGYLGPHLPTQMTS